MRYANAAGRKGRFDFRHLLNGLVDRYIFAAGVVDTDLPFDELRARSRITAAAKAAGNGADFSHRIRAGLPTDLPRRVAQPRSEPNIDPGTITATGVGTAPTIPAITMSR